MSSSARPSLEASYESLSLRYASLFAQIGAGALQRESERELPHEAVAWLDQAGFGALRVPRWAGGVGASVETTARLVADLAEADSNVAHLYRSHFGFVEGLHFQPEAVREHWYARVLAGETVGNASTERSGNALGELNTRLSPDGDSWLLDGSKYYATGSIFSDHTRVTVTVEGVDPTVIQVFAVVPTAAQGVVLEDDWDGFGQTLTGTGTATFDAVHVGADAVLSRQAGGSEAVHEEAFFQLYLLAVLAGIARAARRDAVATIAGRTRTFNTGTGLPFREDPLIQQVVGRISSKAFAAEATVLQAARALDEGLDAAAAAGADAEGYAGPVPYELSLAEIAVEQAQVIVPDLALGAAQQLFETVGASGTSISKGLDRHWRNAQTVATHNPVAFRARSIGDFHLNGTLPEGQHAVGEAPYSLAQGA